MTKDLLPEGFKDDVSSQVATEHKYQNIILDHFQSYGYELIKTPLVEFANIDEEYNSFRIKVKDKEISTMKKDTDKLKKNIKEKDKEIESLNKEILKIKDEELDIQGKLE